jgi:hypothetical protein
MDIIVETITKLKFFEDLRRKIDTRGHSMAFLIVNQDKAGQIENNPHFHEILEKLLIKNERLKVPK